MICHNRFIPIRKPLITAQIDNPRSTHEVIETKYIVFWEYEPQDLVKAIEKLKAFREKVKKNPEKYARSISPNYTMSIGFQGFQLFEADDPEQLARMVLHYRPEVKFEIIHITETMTMLKLYESLK
jgi:hypothetical protein